MKYWLNEKTLRTAIRTTKPTSEPWDSGSWIEIPKERFDIVNLYRNWCLKKTAA